MPAGIKPINCVGKKGRSGRKSMPVEAAKAQALIKAWNKVEQNIDKSDVKDIALPIALKDMTNKVDIPKETLNTLTDLISLINGQGTNKENSG
ncbi:MAG: hypothetical protein WC917_00815 [Bacilli bacterium]|jgi:uncharacterized protein involved in propanediol utilization